jgi:hypothetical protein
MNTRKNYPLCLRCLVLWAAMFFPVMSVNADPISLPEKPVTPTIIFLISFSILLEVLCIVLVLWRVRKPRFFILWLIGMHGLTYPCFLGVLWFLQTMRPVYAVAGGESLMVLVEGMLIYLICRFVASSKTDLTTPSIGKCWLASLIGNACSVVAFPIMVAIYDHILPF